MAKEEKEEATVEQPVKKKLPFLKIIILLLILVVVGAGVYGAIYYFGHSASVKKAEPPPPRPVIGVLWSIEPFIVNLADNQGERYLKLVMQAETSDQAVVAELEQLKPKLRDNILDLLTAKSYAELMDMGGKQRLRDEIVARLNSFLTRGKIVRVYFTEFVIQ